IRPNAFLAFTVIIEPQTFRCDQKTVPSEGRRRSRLRVAGACDGGNLPKPFGDVPRFMTGKSVTRPTKPRVPYPKRCKFVFSIWDNIPARIIRSQREGALWHVRRNGFKQPHQCL